MFDIGNPIDVRPLFAEERADLLAVLTTLDDEEWWLPTVCGDWSVHDVALHILGGDVNNLSGGRDRFNGSPLAPSPGDLDDWPTLVAFIDHRNATWIDANRRISPRVMVDLLAWAGDALACWWPTVDLDAPGIPVSWAGPDPAPTWLHFARELTERWTHQQHIRLATARPGSNNPALVHGVLDTFARALPFTLRHVVRPEGRTAMLAIRGDGGGAWRVRRGAEDWFFDPDRGSDPDCVVNTDVDSAWQAFTLGLTSTERRQRMTYQGDPGVANAIVDMVTIIG